MIDFLVSLIPVSLFIWGAHILFQPDHIFEKQGEWLEDNFGKWSKPVVMCPICQSSLWGLIGFHALDYLFGVHLPYRLLIPYILCLCGLQTIISKAVSKYRIIEEFDTEAFRQLFDLNEKSPAKETKTSK